MNILIVPLTYINICVGRYPNEISSAILTLVKCSVFGIVLRARHFVPNCFMLDSLSIC